MAVAAFWLDVLPQQFREALVDVRKCHLSSTSQHLFLDKFTVNVLAWSPAETISQEDLLMTKLTIELKGGLMLRYTKFRTLTMSEPAKTPMFPQEG